MGRIIVLDENTSNKIAAGEVVEKPASVVKELVENSIDAGATNISIDIKNGGISFIKVTDNGSGMDEDDVEIAFERHATSKIKRAEDLESIATMGFRGEALASIAAVSSVELQTRTAGSTYGMYVHIIGGTIKEVRQTGCPVGTTFIVRDLFFNTPARYKFLKKDSTEAGYISDAITRIALGNPGISFKLTSGKSILLHSPGNNDLKSTIYSIYGKDIIKELLEVSYQDEKYSITGFIGRPEAARANRNYQSLYINKRYVKSRLVSNAVEQAYSSILMKNKFPFFVLNITLNPLLVDVNVSPAKTEVRFAEESYLSRAIYMAISNALNKDILFNPVTVSNRDREIFKFKNVEPKPGYVQGELESEYLEGFKSYSDNRVIAKPEQESRESNYSQEQQVKLFTEALKPLARTDIGKQVTQAKTDTQTHLVSESNTQEGSDTLRQSVSESLTHAVAESQIGTVTDTQIQSVEKLQDQTEVKPQTLLVEDIPSNTDEEIFSQATQETSTRTITGRSHAVTPEVSNAYSSSLNRDLPIKETDSAESIDTFGNSKIKDKHPDLLTMKYIGQAFSTYIILQNGDELVLVDQHAAHERIIYEKLKIKYEEQENTTQLLLEPVVIQYQPFEIDEIRSKQEMLAKIGFVFEDFGNNSIIIRGIPYLLEGCSPKEVFLELTDKILSSLKPVSTPLADEIIHTVACKAAIKANKKLDNREVEQLLTELSQTGSRYTCPHGRPTIIRLTKYEIEKMFKRIV